MSGISEFIVGMWFFPVTVFAIIPLALLLARTIVMLIRNSKLTRRLPTDKKPNF